MAGARVVSLLLIGGLVAASSGCTSTPSSKPKPAVTDATTSTTTVPDDGVLRIGLLVPRKGAGTELGQSIEAGVRLAVNEINAGGGVNGQAVQLLTRPEGDTTATDTSVQELIRSGADAIIGPESSNNALATLGTAVDAGVASCSPTASAAALDQFPDHGLFFRTIPSDSLQAVALAAAVDQTGTATATLVHLDDGYGRPLADDVRLALANVGVTIARDLTFTADDPSIVSTAKQIAADRPGVVVVIADALSGPTMIDDIEADPAGARPTFVVNDAVRRPDSSVQPFNATLSQRIVGVSPLAVVDNVGFNSRLDAVDQETSHPFAANAYDCVNLIALSAQASGSTRATTFAGFVVETSDGGSKCATFVECATALTAGRDIDYDGPSGMVKLSASGDAAAGAFDVFRFDANGRDVSSSRINVG